MAHLNTDNVIVFPVAKERAPSVQETRLMTEYNVSNIVRQLMGNGIKGFIISCSNTTSGWNIEFNLYENDLARQAFETINNAKELLIKISALATKPLINSVE